MSELPEKITLFILDSNESPALFITHYKKWVVDLPSFPSLEWYFFIIDSPKGEDLILGYDFLYPFNPIIDWKNGLITYDSTHKNSSGIESSASNVLVAAVNSAALAGELKTPSVPPSVHIPAIMPSQSLLKSSHEVFKEIKYIGEDVALSSLHLFQGDMDLPPLSFHASLEEKWDEEAETEEIKTVLKVVPPPYHQYLDVFSKVKAEKLPPHPACDHHIELEGLLPPFQLLKEAFTTAPIIYHFNHSLPTFVETDASDYALGAFLSHVNDSGKHPISFDSGKPLPAELNYEIHDKELLGIVWALKRWRAFLISLSNPFEFLTDHSSLQYFISSNVLTCCQAHCAEFLSEFHFTMTYRPGRLATLPDALSHWDDMYPERGVDFITNNAQNSHQVIKQDGIQEPRFCPIKVEMLSDLVDQIQKEVWQDSTIKKYSNSPSGQLSKELESVQQVFKEELESAIRRFKKYADRTRIIPPDFLPGDKVWLASKIIKTTRPTKKLLERWLGPFEVMLITSSCLFNGILVEEQEEWEVAHVLDSKLKRGKLWYLIEYKGFSGDRERTTWELASNLTSSPELVKFFHSLYPDKPGPNTPRVSFYGAWWGLHFMKVGFSPRMHL
ncbi:hypothetical protein O181_042109 [Austropuccinia psidii MF-1]|uniref:Chromo domain-containing protein n=1 Tax=Austropuccinia psidii MF-1 TaxID=1389203 RepID=A0A9Q3DFR4_9BASI|nr:hypothetical protein [Austropuccinia psidii MF-1]